MALKLFRSTGHSTLLMPGETRLAPHPGRLVLAASAWIAFACNVGVWRLLAGNTVAPMHLAASIALLGGASGVFLSLLAWRRTLKLSVTIALLVAALVAAGMWSQQLPVDALWTQRPPRLFPGWASFVRWQVPALLIGLAVLPIAWMWSFTFRRIAGPEQLQANLLGAVLAAVLFGAGLLLVF